MYLHISFKVISAVERSKAKCLELASYHISLTKNKNRQTISEFLPCRSASIFTVNTVYTKKKNFMISESGEKQEKALNNDKNIYISRQNKKKRKQPKKKERILQGLYSSLYSTSDQ